MGGTFPYGTLLINLSGCFLPRLDWPIHANRIVISPDWRIAIAVGFFGGYTTFSSFGWETQKCWRKASGCALRRTSAPSVIAGLLLFRRGIRPANRF